LAWPYDRLPVRPDPGMNLAGIGSGNLHLK
jgi:hypothetical protein